jgi:hypothetical protein
VRRIIAAVSLSAAVTVVACGNGPTAHVTGAQPPASNSHRGLARLGRAASLLGMPAWAQFRIGRIMKANRPTVAISTCPLPRSVAVTAEVLPPIGVTITRGSLVSLL